MPGDRSRISRALEVVLATGRSLSEWHQEGMPPTVDPTDAARFFLDVDRDELTGGCRAFRCHACGRRAGGGRASSPRVGLIPCCRR